MVAIVLANKLAHEARDSGVSGFDMLAGIARSLRASARFFCPFRWRTARPPGFLACCGLQQRRLGVYRPLAEASQGATGSPLWPGWALLYLENQRVSMVMPVSPDDDYLRLRLRKTHSFVDNPSRLRPGKPCP
jgi:hypothetical protein